MSNVEDAKRRRKEKLRASRGKQNLILVVALLTVILAGVGSYYLLNSDLWLLKTISITGNSHVSADRITELAGLDNDTNLMKVSKEDIEAKITREPWIAEAEVTRDLPSRLEVLVVEREPFARVKQRGKLFTLDKKGYVIEATTAVTTDVAPVINEIKTSRLRVGGRAKNALLRDALKSLASISPDLRAKVIWVSVPSLDKLAFHTADDLEIIFGGAEEARKKNLIIKKILADAPEDVVHINVTVPDNPVVRKLQR